MEDVKELPTDIFKCKRFLYFFYNPYNDCFWSSGGSTKLIKDATALVFHYTIDQETVNRERIKLSVPVSYIMVLHESVIELTFEDVILNNPEFIIPKKNRLFENILKLFKT